MKKIISAMLAIVLMLSLTCPALAAAPQTEMEAAADYLREQGIMVGDGNGNMNFEGKLTRSHLATILTRLNGNPEHVQADQAYYTGQCTFLDVPEWARLYVGYCKVNGLMVGYDNGLFGGEDSVTPEAACTVILRYLEFPETDWNYSTACQKALDLGLTSEDVVSGAEITRGQLAIMIYRALGNHVSEGTDAVGVQTGNLRTNADGSINLSSDGSQYVPRAGDVIRCDDGTNYTITDVSRWSNSMFASDPTDALPEPVCDWSLLPQPELPAAETRHFTANGKDYLFVRNLYETRRMLYTLYNAIGSNPETWQNGAPVLFPSGNQKVRINLTISDDLTPQSFWPWRESEIVNLFNSCPPGTYSMEAWDVYCNGIYQYTEYKIHVI